MKANDITPAAIETATRDELALWACLLRVEVDAGGSIADALDTVTDEIARRDEITRNGLAALARLSF